MDSSDITPPRHPTLGNNVVVGVGAKIIGNITIGDGSKIGAGSVVVSSVPPNATVVGVPGRVVAIRNPDTDTVEKLPDPVGERLQILEAKVADLEKRLQIQVDNTFQSTDILLSLLNEVKGEFG